MQKGMKQLIYKEDVLQEISSSDDVFATEAEQEYLWERIQMLPLVNAVPVRHGKWENSRPDAPMFGFYYCSLCGRKRTSPQDRYCPNCGARMNEE